MTRLPYNDHDHQCTHSHCIHSVAPDQVSGVRFVPSPGGNSLSVEWSRPQSDVPILYYEIQYRSNAGSRSWLGPVNVTTESVILRSSLVPSATYGVQVRAVSAIGTGPYSSEETIKRSFQHVQYTYTHTHTHTHAHTKNTQIHNTCIYKHTHTMKYSNSILCHIIWCGAV